MRPEAVSVEADFTPAKIYMWVKSLESKVNNLLREVDVLKGDFIAKNNSIKRDLKAFNEDLIELKHQQDKVLQKIDLIIKELQKTAGAEEVASLQKYIDLWNPLNFITQRDAQRIIEDQLAGVQKTMKRHIYTRKANRRKAIKRHRASRKKKTVEKHKRKVIHHAN
ncbi:hypothetical protein J4479_04940 [Candidatus Woesearchaeota archaeon]|nr:hypothetical protein [Candidatus Woesearchaeota archaeon]